MKNILILLTSGMAALVAAQGNLQIDTPPSIVQCQPAAIGFRGGQAPYFISILPGGQSTAAPLQQFPQQATAGSLTWTANIRAGTAITFQIRDGTGTLNYSDQVTILPGDAGCLGGDAGPVVSSASSVPASTTATSSSLSSASSSSSPSSRSSSATTVASSSASSSALATATTAMSSFSSTVADRPSSIVSGATSAISSAVSPVSSGVTPSAAPAGAAYKRAEGARAAVAGLVLGALAFALVA